MKIIKTGVAGLLFVLVLVHVTCTLFYTLPGKIIPVNLHNRATGYIRPLFDQHWSLFAPVPEMKKKVMVSYKTSDGSWSNWEDPFREYLYHHQANRLSANTRIAFSISNALHFLYNENKEKLKENKWLNGDTTSGYFRVLRFAVYKQLTNKEKEPVALRMLLLFSPAQCDSKEYSGIYYSGNGTAN